MVTRPDEWDEIIDEAASTDLNDGLPYDFARRILQRYRVREETREPSTRIWFAGMVILAVVFAIAHVTLSLPLYITLLRDVQTLSSNFRLDLVLVVAGILTGLEFLARSFTPARKQWGQSKGTE